MFEAAKNKAERLRERQKENSEARAKQFNFKTMEDVTNELIETGEIVTPSSESSHDDVEDEEVILCPREERVDPEPEGTKKGRKRQFIQRPESDDDPLPKRFRHIREISERSRLGLRKVKDDFYKTVANLSGTGLFTHEATTAVVLVGNGLFGRSWKTYEEAEVLDNDTTPHKANIIAANRLVEAQSLSLAMEEVEKKKEEGRMLTHAMDSTTKKGAGQFAVQGLHIGQESAIPLPILPIHGETTEDIATQVISFI